MDKSCISLNEMKMRTVNSNLVYAKFSNRCDLMLSIGLDVCTMQVYQSQNQQ
jgi:hypothetical protein